ncbi:MAG: FtsX-like permease family protein [Bryobacteraceae bacterium]|nr:FtsX-like permease family protein [Bryobacteraceae bacterium]
MRPGVAVEQAHAEMQAIARNVAKAHPETNGAVGAAVIPLAARITGEIRPALLIAWAAVSLVLLLGCANVAHLVMIHSVSRSREMAVRAACGASALQLIRVLLAENLILAFAGGGLGVALAGLMLPLLGKLAASDIPRLDSLSLTPMTLLFGCAAAVFCALLFALPAIFHTRSTDVQRAIKQSAVFPAAHRHSLFGAAVVAVEIALAFVGIAGACLLFRSFGALLDEDPGFDAVQEPSRVRGG